MTKDERIAIVGGGPNGLVAACYLAKAGRKPLVLERREQVGGVAATEEFSPGFRCSSVLHGAGPFLPSIASDLRLDRHGLSWVQSEVRVFAPGLDGRALRLFGDPQKTAAELEGVCAHDAKGYVAFHESLGRIGRVLEPLLTMTPPSIDDPSLSEMWDLLGVGRRFRGLPRRDAFRLLRWGPMAVADLVSEFFESELLRAAVAARGIYGTFAGPWSAGTSLGVILQAASDANAAGPSAMPRGGMGGLTQALAASARALGAEIRTGAEVTRIQTKDGAAVGVVLASGEEVPARAVVAERGSQADAARAGRSDRSRPRLHPARQELPIGRLARQGPPGAVGAARLRGAARRRRQRGERDGRLEPRRPDPHRSRDRLSGAGVRRRQVRRLLAASVLRRDDPDGDGPDARSAGPARDVDRGPVRSVPSEVGRLEDGRQA